MKKYIVSCFYSFIISWVSFDLYSSSKQSKEFTQAEKLLLQQDRTTNLVIAHDYFEFNSSIGSDAMGIVLKNSLDENQLVLTTKTLWEAYGHSGFNIPEGYVCKEVNDNLLLFIPKRLQNPDQSSDVQNALLGLNYTNFPNYDYGKYDMDKVSELREKYLKLDVQTRGKILLDALQKLRIQAVDSELLPFFNIFLGGHGVEGEIAELSVKTDTANKSSDFLNVMNFFDKALRTRSVALLSCFIGGKQITDTYGVYDQDGKPRFNKYNNGLLENLSYPIINWGALFKPVFVKRNLFNVSQYFELINAFDYEKILDSMRVGSIDSYISVKLPHTSWFSPVQLNERTKTLSQVAMSTRENLIDIKKNIEVLILEANYIPQEVIIESYFYTHFMPVNYHNQYYYFKSLRVMDGYGDIFSILKDFIFKDIAVREEINFAFEKFQIGNTVYKNVQYFIHKKENSKLARSGLIFEDPQGRVFKYSWPADVSPSSLKDLSVKVEQINQETWQKEFDHLSSFVQSKLPEALNENFVQNLGKRMSVQKSNKIVVGKYLDAIFEQLEKNLLKPKNLTEIMAVLEKANKNPNILVVAQTEKIFNKLIAQHIITVDNYKQLVPFLTTIFNTSDKVLHNQAQIMIRSMIRSGIINSDNWTELIPLLNKGIESSNQDVQRNVANLIRMLVDKKLIFSIETIEPLLIKGLNSSFWREYESIIFSLSYAKIITKADIEKIVQRISDSYVQERIESLKGGAPEKIEVPLDQVAKLLSTLNLAIKRGVFSDEEMNLLKEFVEDKSISLDQVLSLFKEGMDASSNGSGQSNALKLAPILLSEKIITTDTIAQSIIPKLEKDMNSSTEYQRSSVIRTISNLIYKNLITEDSFMKYFSLIQKGMDDQDNWVVRNTIDLIQDSIDKNYIDKENIEGLLPLIVKGMANQYNRDKFIPLIMKLADKNLIPQKYLKQFENGIDDPVLQEKLKRLQETTKTKSIEPAPRDAAKKKLSKKQRSEILERIKMQDQQKRKLSELQAEQQEQDNAELRMEHI